MDLVVIPQEPEESGSTFWTTAARDIAPVHQAIGRLTTIQAAHPIIPRIQTIFDDYLGTRFRIEVRMYNDMKTAISDDWRQNKMLPTMIGESIGSQLCYSFPTLSP